MTPTRWAVVLCLLACAASAQRLDRLQQRLDRRDRLGGGASGPLLNMALTGNCEGTTPAGLTFTRTSTATCTDSNGVLKTLAANVPRLESQGLLVEGAATNSLLYSSDWTQAVWAKSNAACTLTVTGPDGLPASVCSASAAGATATQALTLAAAQRASSLYLRNATCSVEVTHDGATWLPVSGLDSAWKRVAPSCASGDSRCIAVAGLTSSVANPVVGVRLGSASCSVEAAGAQDESGPVATSYIPTAGTQVTRAADTYGTTTPPWLSTAEGCSRMCIVPRWPGLTTAASVLLASGAGGNARFLFVGPSSGATQAWDGTGATVLVQGNFAMGVQACYRTQWSASGNFLRLTNETTTEVASKAFTGMPAFTATVGNSTPGLPYGLAQLRLSNAPGGCAP